MTTTLVYKNAAGNLTNVTYEPVKLGKKPEWVYDVIKDGVKPEFPIAQLSAEVDYKIILHLLVSATCTPKDATSFLVRYASKLQAELEANWISYDVVIGVAGARISPLDILNFKFNTPTGTVIERNITEEGLFSLILCMYRLGKVNEMKHTEYTAKIKTNIGTLLTTSPFEVPDTLWNSVTADTASSFARDVSFRRVVACIDMFFTKFPVHTSAPLRIGTLSTAYEDCSILGAFELLPKLLGVDPLEAPLYIFEKQAADEMIILIDNKEETTKYDSYFVYSRSMGIIQKSPFSATASPRFHAYVHGLGSFLQIDRSFNATKVYSGDLSGVINIVCLMAGLVQVHSNKKYEAEEEAERECQAVPDLDLNEDDLDGFDEPLEDFSPQSVLRTIKKRMPYVNHYLRKNKPFFDNAPFRVRSLGAYIKGRVKMVMT